MKKIKNLVPIILALMLFSACSKNADVKQLLTDLSTAIANNDKATIEKMYPDAAKADSLSLTFDAEKAQIEELKDGGFKVVLDKGKDITITKNEADGSLTVKESHGIFFVSDAEKNFALKTGLIKQDMNDATIAEQLADSTFITYVSDDFMNTFRKNLRITKVWDNRYEYASDYTGGGEWFITVKNDCDFDIAGSDYKVIVASTSPSRKVVTLDGKDLFSGSQETFKTGFLNPEFSSNPYEVISYDPKIRLEIKLSPAELLGKYYNPKGDEYENYLKTK